MKSRNRVLTDIWTQSHTAERGYPMSVKISHLGTGECERVETLKTALALLKLKHRLFQEEKRTSHIGYLLKKQIWNLPANRT